MATPAQLSDEYRARQLEIAQGTARDMLNVAGALNFKAVDLSASGWLTAVESIVYRRYDQAMQLGQDMYLGFRSASGIPGAGALTLPQLDRDRMLRAMIVLGPYAAKHGMSEGTPIPDIVKSVVANTTGSAVRASLGGARDTVQGTAVADSQCIGYTRVTSGSPCNFCAMVAANTYRSIQSASESSGTRRRSAAPQPARSSYHNHCKCRAVPIFNQTSWPEDAKRRANEYADFYHEVSAGGGTQKEIESRFLSSFEGRFGGDSHQ